VTISLNRFAVPYPELVSRDRALHVAQLAAVNPALCRILAALLDERAPWTDRHDVAAMREATPPQRSTLP
jgi:predicted kinase